MFCDSTLHEKSMLSKEEHWSNVEFKEHDVAFVFLVPLPCFYHLQLLHPNGFIVQCPVKQKLVIKAFEETQCNCTARKDAVFFPRATGPNLALGKKT